MTGNSVMKEIMETEQRFTIECYVFKNSKIGHDQYLLKVQTDSNTSLPFI